MAQVGIPLGYGQDAAAIYNYLYQNYLEQKQYFYDNYDFDIYPAIPFADPITGYVWDDEFNDLVLDGKWTKYLEPAPPNGWNEAKFPGFLWVGLPMQVIGNILNWPFLYQSPPSFNQVFEVIAKVSVTSDWWSAPTIGGDFTTISLGLCDPLEGAGNEGRFLGIFLQIRHVWESSCAVYSVNSLGGGGGGTPGLMTKNKYISGILTRGIYLKFIKSTTNAYTVANSYKVEVSFDGRLWHYVGSCNYAFVNAPSRLGFMYVTPAPEITTPIGFCLIDFFRRTV